MTLDENCATLESSLPRLKENRNRGPLQNDIYEAIEDFCHLVQWAIKKDTRVNYPGCAASWSADIEKLRRHWAAKDPAALKPYEPQPNLAEEMIKQIAEIPLPRDGHLGVLRTIKKHFGWLFEQFGFSISEEGPMGVCLSSGHVFLELSCAVSSSLSFSMSHDQRSYFWIEDLLFLYRDEQYKSIPLSLNLNTEEDVESWFSFVAEILRAYGQELLRNEPSAWSRLSEAQSRRDAEYAAMMEEKYGPNSAGR